MSSINRIFARPAAARASLALVLAALLCAPASADNRVPDHEIKTAEAALQKAFEGKLVTVKIDMPATSMGIDIRPHTDQPMGFRDYQSRIKSNGIAVRRGETIMVTKLKATSHLIEFQLGGGGYGTFLDALANSGSAGSYQGKSQREKNLELELKSERDPVKRRAMDEELDKLRRDRAREATGTNAEQRLAAQAQAAATREKALQGGSRFNLRFRDGISATDLTPEAVRAALAEWVDFGDEAPKEAPATLSSAPATGGAAPATVHKGSKLAEVAAIWGEPTSSKASTENDMAVLHNTYKKGARILEAMFIEGVLVKYSISEE